MFEVIKTENEDDEKDVENNANAGAKKDGGIRVKDDKKEEGMTFGEPEEGQ